MLCRRLRPELPDPSRLHRTVRPAAPLSGCSCYPFGRRLFRPFARLSGPSAPGLVAAARRPYWVLLACPSFWTRRLSSCPSGCCRCYLDFER